MLAEQLRKAELIIFVQKKVATLFEQDDNTARTS